MARFSELLTKGDEAVELRRMDAEGLKTRERWERKLCAHGDCRSSLSVHRQITLDGTLRTPLTRNNRPLARPRPSACACVVGELDPDPATDLTVLDTTRLDGTCLRHAARAGRNRDPASLLR